MACKGSKIAVSFECPACGKLSTGTFESTVVEGSDQCAAGVKAVVKCRHCKAESPVT